MEGRHVLVVDDDASLRLLCRVNLSLDGFDVTEAGSLEAARAVLRGGGVDLVILDLKVGSDSGADLLRELRAQLQTVRVALLTGQVDIEPELAQLADAVILKPFDLEQLGATARRLTG